MSGILSARLAFAALAAFVAAFLAVNIGLRLMPQGRAFLSAARDRGRLFAAPTRQATPPEVRAIFVLSYVLAIVAGVSMFLLSTPQTAESRPPVLHFGPYTAERSP